MENNQQSTQDEQYINEKNLLLRGQYDILVRKFPNFSEVENSFEIFQDIWNKSEEYMIQIFRYAMAEKEKSNDK